MAVITRFDSPELWMKPALEREAKSRKVNGLKPEDGRAHMYASQIRQGDPSIVPMVNDALSRITQGLNLEPVLRYLPSVAGSRVSVPTYLAGNPQCMRRRQTTEFTTRHVCIYIEACVMGDIGREDIRARNTAIIGLIEALRMQRIAADIFASWDWGTWADSDGDHWQVVKLETRPLDLPNIAACLSEAAFSMSYVMGGVIDSDRTGGVSRSFKSCECGRTAEGKKRFEAIYREKVGLNPTDVYIPEIRPTDQVVTDPIGWIERQISQLQAH